MEKAKIYTASANTGIGLLTSICVFFASIGGVESLNFKNKQQKILNTANKRLVEALAKDGITDISDYRIVWQGKLNVAVSVMGVVSKGETTKEDTHLPKDDSSAILNEAIKKQQNSSENKPTEPAISPKKKTTSLPKVIVRGKDTYDIGDRIILESTFTDEDIKVEKGTTGVIEDSQVSYGGRRYTVVLDNEEHTTVNIPGRFFE